MLQGFRAYRRHGEGNGDVLSLNCHMRKVRRKLLNIAMWRPPVPESDQGKVFQENLVLELSLAAKNPHVVSQLFPIWTISSIFLFGKSHWNTSGGRGLWSHRGCAAQRGGSVPWPIWGFGYHKKRDTRDESEKTISGSYVMLCYVFFSLQDCGFNVLQSYSKLFQHVPTNCTDGAPGWATCGLVTGAGSSMWALLGHGPGNSVCFKMGTSEKAILGKIMIKFWGLPSETHRSGETQDVLTVLSTSGFDPIETHPLPISTGTVGLFVQTFCLAGHKGPSKGFFPILLHLCRQFWLVVVLFGGFPKLKRWLESPWEFRSRQIDEFLVSQQESCMCLQISRMLFSAFPVLPNQPHGEQCSNGHISAVWLTWTINHKPPTTCFSYSTSQKKPPATTRTTTPHSTIAKDTGTRAKNNASLFHPFLHMYNNF